jgi:hypothetical protein
LRTIVSDHLFKVNKILLGYSSDYRYNAGVADGQINIAITMKPFASSPERPVMISN